MEVEQKDSSNRKSVIRPAASLLVLRTAADGVDVLTLKRAESMRFLPGFLSFPGGSIDANDHVVAEELCTGEIRQQDQADDMAYAAGALRECAEETGLVFALMDKDSKQRAIALDSGTQARLLSSQLQFLDFLRNGNWNIRADRLRFVGNWVTPPGLNARFETRFFAYQTTAEETEATSIRVNEHESAWGQWMAPVKLLQDARAGRAKAAPPTLAMLEALAKCKTADECMSSLTVPPPSPEELEKLAKKLTQP